MVPAAFASELNVVYIPQLGCLVAVSLRDEGCPAPTDWELSVSLSYCPRL